MIKPCSEMIIYVKNKQKKGPCINVSLVILPLGKMLKAVQPNQLELLFQSPYILRYGNIQCFD